MSGICGWLECAAGRDNAADVARAMLAANTAAPISAVTARHWAAATKSPRIRIYEDDTCITIIDGRPRWLDAAIAETARAQGDAAALAHAYGRFGRSAPEKLAGTFSLAHIDKAHRSLLLAVDRMGVRPLAYAPVDGGVVFGSSLECLRRHPAVVADVDPQAVFDYLYFHVIPSPLTIYRGVYKLEPGTAVFFQDNRCRVLRYWSPAFQDEPPESFDALAAELHRVLRQAVTRAGPEEAGLFLSGGVDSSTVCGVYTELRGRPADTFSIGFDVPGYDEMEYARIAARRFASRAHEYYLAPRDVAEAMPVIAGAYDEPFGNSSALAVYCCARLAHANGHQLLLAGDGGDEIFAGNVRYVKQKIFELYGRLPPGLRRYVLEPVTIGFPLAARVPLLRKACSYISQANVPLPDRLESHNQLNRVPLAEMLTPEFLAQIDSRHPLVLLREAYARAQSGAALNRLLYLDWKFTLADNDIRKVNRMCEINGVEVRYPMLDDALVEFSMRVPPQLKIKGLRLRYFFKRAMAGFLPKETIAKPKHGFGLPFGAWLRQEPLLQERVQDALTRFQQRGYVRRDYIARLMRAHHSEHAAFYGSNLWVLTMLELWLQAHGGATAA